MYVCIIHMYICMYECMQPCMYLCILECLHEYVSAIMEFFCHKGISYFLEFHYLWNSVFLKYFNFGYLECQIPGIARNLKVLEIQNSIISKNLYFL